MEFKVFEDKESLGKALAECLAALVKQKPNAVLGLATGSSPIPTYQALIQIAHEEGISFKEVTTFNLDEYVGLPEDDPESYRTFMRKELFSSLDFMEGAHHFPSEENMKDYDSMIDRKGGIDIQVLGIGTNGHIGFNEPETPFDSKTHVTTLAESTRHDNARFFGGDINAVPKKAVTMGLRTILGAKEIVLIATGKNKAEAIKKLHDGKADPSCPATILSERPEGVTIYLDKEAASLIA